MSCLDLDFLRLTTNPVHALQLQVAGGTPLNPQEPRRVPGVWSTPAVLPA